MGYWQIAIDRPILVLIRYSVLSYKTLGWRLNRDNDICEYKKILFNDNRLAERLKGFKNIVLPSLMAQTIRLDPNMFRIIVLTSNELPIAHLNALRSTLAPYKWANIHQIPADISVGAEFQNISSQTLIDMGIKIGPYASVRLDDDDALSRGYFERLSKYITTDNLGKVVSFPLGYLGKYDHDEQRYTSFAMHDEDFTAQGLASICHFDGKRVDGTIFSFGNHTKIAVNHPYILDRLGRFYIWSIYPSQDTRGRGWREVTTINEENVRIDFEFK